MFSTKNLVLLLAVTGTAIASPTFINKLSSKIVKRADPVDYPLGDACENEWKYLNWDDEADQAQLEALHKAVCDDLPLLLKQGVAAANDKAQIFERYFGDDDETNDGVIDALGKLYSDDKITEIVKEAIIDKNDFGKEMEGEDNCDNEGTFGYTLNDPNDGDRWKSHICPIAFESKDLGGLNCGDFDSHASDKMDSLSRVVLHELLHYPQVGEESAIEFQIVDVRNEDGATAYGPERAHGLISQDEKDDLVDTNADNYAWMAVEAYWSNECAEDKEKWEEYLEDPPEYEPISDEEEEEEEEEDDDEDEDEDDDSDDSDDSDAIVQ